MTATDSTHPDTDPPPEPRRASVRSLFEEIRERYALILEQQAEIERVQTSIVESQRQIQIQTEQNQRALDDVWKLIDGGG